MAIAEEVLADEALNTNMLSIDELTTLAEKAIELGCEEKKTYVGISREVTRTKLTTYADQVIARMHKAGRHGNAVSIRTGVKSLLAFYGNEHLCITDIDEPFLLNYEADCQQKGMSVNSYGAYLRAVRSVFNLAIKDKNTEVLSTDYPFGKSGYSIKKGASKKKAVKTEVLDRLRALNYPVTSPLWHHRNYFLFMYNCRGMNFIDLAFLRLDNIQQGRLRYQRTKTKRAENAKEFNIKLTEEATEILSAYTTEKRNDNLIFPIMEDVINYSDSKKIHTVYKNRLCNYNRRLATISQELGLEKKLTTYTARHTFATTGLHRGVSKAQIGDMLGHTNYYTTEAYFDDFDKEVLDDAADQILG